MSFDKKKTHIQEETETVDFIRVGLKDAEVWYCKNFLDNPELWYEVIDEETNWEQMPVKVFGKVFNQPRLSSYVSDNNKPYWYSGYDRQPSEWTNNLEILRCMLEESILDMAPKHPKLNAALLNKYRDGDDYIGAHSDDEGDLHKKAYIVSISLGAERDFVFKHKETDERLVLPLCSGSVVLMGKNCQKKYKHSIPKRKRVKKPRINITYRSVLIRDGSGSETEEKKNEK